MMNGMDGVIARIGRGGVGNRECEACVRHDSTALCCTMSMVNDKR